MSENTPVQDTDAKPTFLTEKQYDQLKWVALIGLPAIGVLYFALSQLWDLPKGEQVVGSVTVFDTFLGIVLGISKKQYDESGDVDGVIELSPDESGEHTDMNVQLDPQKVLTKKNLRVKVKKNL